MGSQESMFADQDQEATDKQQVYRPQPINSGSNGQIRSKAVPLQDRYDQGYTGYDSHAEQWQAPLPDEYTGPYSAAGPQRWHDGKIRPQQLPAKPRNMYWLWVPVLVLVFIFALTTGIARNVAQPEFPSSSVAMSGMPPINQGIPSATQSFSVGDHPLLQINVGTADVHITANAENTVYITNNGVGGDRLFSNQDNNTINVDGPSDTDTTGGDNGTTLDIMTPANSNIELRSAAGQVTINGISGQVNINVQEGDVNLSQMALTGQSNIHVERGSINFDGSLDPIGRYNMNTGTGNIDVTLPADASFHLTKGADTIINEFDSTSNGSNPKPPLSLHSDTGQVSLHKSA